MVKSSKSAAEHVTTPASSDCQSYSQSDYLPLKMAEYVTRASLNCSLSLPLRRPLDLMAITG